MSDEAVTEWGAGDEMSATEAMMWRTEADPLLRSSGVVLELLDATPEWERFVEGHAWALRRVPRLRHRVVDDPARIGMPAWVESEVDLDHHVRRRQLPDGGELADVLRIASELHMTELERDRPQWQAILVEGLPDGRAAYLLKLHHSLADATAVVQLFDILHSDRREPSPDKPELPPLPPAYVSPAALTAKNAGRALRGSIGGAARLAKGAVAKGVEVARDPGAAFDYAKSLRRVTGETPGDPSPLMAERGLVRHLDVIDVAFAELRGGAKAADGTLNDAFLAALLSGLHRYHERAGVEIGDLTVALPVSLRSDEDAEGGNKFAGARIAGPAGAMDAAERMRVVGERVRAARFEPALDFMGVSADVVSRVPTPILTRLTAAFTTTNVLQASNFRGLTRDAYLAGAKVERWFAFGPAPGCAMMATLASHGDRCCVGLTLDVDAVTDPDAMVQCMREGFDEVIALAPSTAAR